jgi:hypothetical protein
MMLSTLKDETVLFTYAERLAMSPWVAVEMAETDPTNAALVC